MKEELMLTEGGVWLAMMMAETAPGTAFRHWLAEHVLPEARKSGFLAKQVGSSRGSHPDACNLMDKMGLADPELGKRTKPQDN